MAFFVPITVPPFVQGDTPRFTFPVKIESTRTIAKAWCTCKVSPTDADAAAVFQVIGTLDAGTDNGDGTKTYQITFALNSTQSAAVPLNATQGDVQIKLDDGQIRTPVVATFSSVVGYTTTTT